MCKYIFVFFILLSTNAHARWMEMDEAEVSEKISASVKINKDLMSVEEIQSTTTLLTERAIGRHGTRVFEYSGELEEFEVHEAYTKNGDQIFKVGKDAIEDKAKGAESHRGFNTRKVVTIAFPHVQKNSELFISYTKKQKKLTVPGFFQFDLNLYGILINKGSELTIESAVPLYSELKGLTSSHYEKTENSQNSPYKLEIKVIEPFFFSSTDEPFGFQKDPEKYPYIRVANTRSHQVMLGKLLPLFNMRYQEKLPDELLKILEGARGKKSFVDQANYITSNLTEKFRYMGIWRDVNEDTNNWHIPRPLHKIVDTHYGDCKDFAFITSKLFQALGYEAYSAYTFRGAINALPINRSVAGMDTNHAIVKAIADGKVYWIDPTNFFSRAEFPMEDIQGRKAYVINLQKGPTVEWIPFNPASSNGRTFHYESSFSPIAGSNSTYIYHTKSHLHFFGTSGLSLAEFFFFRSPKEQADSVKNFVVGNKKIHQLHQIELPKKLERHSSNIEIDYDVSYFDIPSQTTMGPALPAYPHFRDIRDGDFSTYVDGMMLSTSPFTWTYETNYKQIEILTNKMGELNCKVEAPWLSYERILKMEGKDSLFTEKYQIISPTIPAEQLQGERFKTLQDDLRRCMNDLMLVYKK